MNPPPAVTRPAISSSGSAHDHPASWFRVTGRPIDLQVVVETPHPGTAASTGVAVSDDVGLEFERRTADVVARDDQVVDEHHRDTCAPGDGHDPRTEPGIQLGGPEAVRSDDAIDGERASEVDLASQLIADPPGDGTHLLAN